MFAGRCLAHQHINVRGDNPIVGVHGDQCMHEPDLGERPLIPELSKKTVLSPQDASTENNNRFHVVDLQILTSRNERIKPYE